MPPHDGATAPSCAEDVTVLIAARDEARVLPRLLSDLGRQDFRAPGGSPRFRVVVVDDGSVDRTGASAEAALAAAGLVGCVVRRCGGRKGKGDALAFASAEDLGEAALVVVLDADARVDEEFVRRAAALHGAGLRAFTARRRILGAGTSMRARLQADEQILDGFLLERRIALGGGGELRGNGMAVARAELERVGGWPTGVLTEDLELSTRLLAAGVPIAWVRDLVVWEAATATPAAFWRQRLRWAEGSARRFLTSLPAATTSRRAPARTRLDMGLYAGQLLLPPLILGAVVGGASRGRPAPALALAGTYVGAGCILAWQALGRLEPGARRGPRAARAVLAGLFAAQWLAVLPAALVRIALGADIPDFVQTRDRLDLPDPEVPDPEIFMNESQ